jgi:hypothetical protein
MNVGEKTPSIRCSGSLGPAWPGKRCVAKTRSGGACQKPAIQNSWTRMGRKTGGSQADLSASGGHRGVHHVTWAEALDRSAVTRTRI